VQLWRSPATGSNVFTPIAGTAVSVSFPGTDLVIPGNFFAATLNLLGIPVVNQDRLLLVATVTSADNPVLLAAVTGYISAGLAIS
jgi:hypothetical protein